MDKDEIVRILLSILDEIVEDTQETLINHLILHNRRYKSKKCSLYAKFIDSLVDYL